MPQKYSRYAAKNKENNFVNTAKLGLDFKMQMAKFGLDFKMQMAKLGKQLLLLLGVNVYHLVMSLSRPLAAPSTTASSLAMSLAAARHAAT